MKTGLLTMILTWAALNAAAAAPAAPTTERDPLMRQILSKQLTQANGGVTGVVRIASGQAIILNLTDPSLAISTETLRDAVAEPRARASLTPAQAPDAKPPKNSARRTPAIRVLRPRNP